MGWLLKINKFFKIEREYFISLMYIALFVPAFGLALLGLLFRNIPSVGELDLMSAISLLAITSGFFVSTIIFLHRYSRTSARNLVEFMKMNFLKIAVLSLFVNTVFSATLGGFTMNSILFVGFSVAGLYLASASIYYSQFRKPVTMLLVTILLLSYSIVVASTLFLQPIQLP